MQSRGPFGPVAAAKVFGWPGPLPAADQVNSTGSGEHR